MNILFRKVTQGDIDKFPVWYERIGGPELFSNLLPSTFLSFEKSKDLLWFIILDDDDEIGTIWFERKDPDMVSYNLGIYLNRINLFGKGIGKKVIRSAIDIILGEKEVQNLYLNVRHENIRAIRCYQRLGFKTVQEWEKTTESGKISVKKMKLTLKK